MKFNILTATLFALAISVGAFTSTAKAADAGPVVDTYAINVNGNPAGFVAAAKKIFAKVDELGIKSERHIYLSEIGGANTNVVYVIVEHKNLADLESAGAKIRATEEWTAFMKAMKDMGQAITAREVLRELYGE